MKVFVNHLIIDQDNNLIRNFLAYKTRYSEKKVTKKWKKFFNTHLPITDWLFNYQWKSFFVNDRTGQIGILFANMKFVKIYQSVFRIFSLGFHISLQLNEFHIEIISAVFHYQIKGLRIELQVQFYFQAC